MATLAVLLLLLAVSQSSLATYRRTSSYEDQVLVKCEAMGKENFQLLQEDDSVDMWKVRADGSVDLRVGREAGARMARRFPLCSVAVENLEEFIQEAEGEMMNTTVNATWFEQYHEYADIVNWYKDLSNTYSSIAKFVPSIGQSVEKRDMPALHIAGSRIPADPMKIYFQCQIHAREWISGATCMYIANYLLENYGKDEQVTTLLNSLEFVFVPFVNPDGYAYTWSDDRLWRKNRETNRGSSCDGVDLNRNYPVKWGGGGSSSNPCSETYHGTSAESEPETQNTINYFRGQGKIIGAIDWHSYSQLILRPYGWTTKDCPDEAQLKELGTQMHNAAYKVHGKDYESIKSIDLYITTGTASDWFYSDDAAESNKGYRPAGYTIELRDTGRYGFLLPPDQIIPTGQEMVPTVIVFAQSLLREPIPYPRN